jgi:hypothetical protein
MNSYLFAVLALLCLACSDPAPETPRGLLSPSQWAPPCREGFAERDSARGKTCVPLTPEACIEWCRESREPGENGCGCPKAQP